MTPTPSFDNQRRAQRKRAAANAMVTDVISGKSMGQLGNLSSTGMLLIGPQAPRSEAIYQVRVALSPTGQSLRESQPIELGIQEQWHEAAKTTGQIWSGYRIVAITDIDNARLEGWLAQA